MTEPNDHMHPGKETKQVLEILKNNGMLSTLQTEALERLKKDPRFRKHVENLVSNSEAIRKRYKGFELANKVKAELEGTVVEDTSLWLFEMLSSPEKGFVPTLETYVLSALNSVHTQQISEGGGKASYDLQAREQSMRSKR